jgi:hypothetical protein
MPETDLIASGLTFSKYAGRVWRQFKTDFKSEVVPTVTAILAILVVLMIQWRSGWIRGGEGWATIVLNLAPSIGIFVLYLVYHFGRAPYLLDRTITIDLMVKRKENEILEDFVNNPRLELLFAMEKPYFNIVESGRSGNTKNYRSYFRVKVQNISGQTIDNVKVQLEELNGYYNIPLRILNDNIPHRDAFTLSPGQHEIIQVAEKLTNNNGFSIVRTHRQTALPEVFPVAEHEINIVATGNGTMRRNRVFKLSFTEEGHLSVEPLATPDRVSLTPYTQGSSRRA